MKIDERLIPYLPNLFGAFVVMILALTVLLTLAHNEWERKRDFKRRCKEAQRVHDERERLKQQDLENRKASAIAHGYKGLEYWEKKRKEQEVNHA